MNLTNAQIDEIVNKLFIRFKQILLNQTLLNVDITPISENTLDAWLVIYRNLLQHRGYKPQTIKNRTSNLKHISRLWGTYSIAELKPRNITEALQEFIPDRSTMARRVYDELRDVYQEAIANDWCSINPVLNTRKPISKVKRKRLSIETWDLMCEAALVHNQSWVLPMLLLALLTGQRRSDLAKMSFNDIWDNHLHIEQQKKAGKEYGARIALPLSLKLDIIGISLADVVEICKTYTKIGPTLLRKHDGSSIEVSSLSSRFTELIRNVTTYNENEWPSLHEIRSLSERLYRLQGIQTQILLGHKTQDMTDKYNDDRGLSANEWKHLTIQS